MTHPPTANDSCAIISTTKSKRDAHATAQRTKLSFSSVQQDGPIVQMIFVRRTPSAGATMRGKLVRVERMERTPGRWVIVAARKGAGVATSKHGHMCVVCGCACNLHAHVCMFAGECCRATESAGKMGQACPPVRERAPS